MNRRELLKRAVPVVALAPVAVAEGVARYSLEPAGHFLFVVDIQRVDIVDFARLGNAEVPLMPPGSKGGWIIGVSGDPSTCLEILRLDEQINAEEILGRPPDLQP